MDAVYLSHLHWHLLYSAKNFYWGRDCKCIESNVGILKSYLENVQVENIQEKKEVS